MLYQNSQHKGACGCCLGQIKRCIRATDGTGIRSDSPLVSGPCSYDEYFCSREEKLCEEAIDVFPVCMSGLGLGNRSLLSCIICGVILEHVLSSSATCHRRCWGVKLT